MQLFPKNAIEQEKEILWFFDLALILKALNGALEVVGAILILVIPPSFVFRVAEFLTGGELAQDPDDPVATALLSAAHTFTIHNHYLLAAYLVLHGIVKVILVWGIFAGKRIAYPLFMIALGIFATYEAYRGFARHELFLQALAVFDLSVILLTSYEYRQRYGSRPYFADTRADYAGQSETAR